MPSNAQRLFGVIASVAITVGGAWIASQIHSEPVFAETAPVANGLHVTFKDVRNNEGTIIVMVFADSAAYDSVDVTKVVGYKEKRAQTGQVQVSFPELKDGPYAVTAFHDENANQDLDMNGQLPLEGYATSGAADAYDMRSYEKAAVAMGNHIVQMHYLN